MEAGSKTAEWMTMEEITPVSLPIKKMLLATDGSCASVGATKYCVGLAKTCNAEILAVYVSGQGEQSEPSAHLNGKQFFGGVHPSEAGLAVAKAFGEKNGVKVNATVLRGSVARNIIKAAVADHIDLIVIGDSGRSGLSRTTLGTVAEAVMKLAPCPVLIVRASD